MKRLSFGFLALFASVLAAQFEAVDKPRYEFFGTANLTGEWAADAKLLDDKEQVKDAGKAEMISAALKRAEGYSGKDVAAIRGLIPGMLTVAGNAPAAAARIQAADALKHTFLKDKTLNEDDRRIAKELIKLIEHEKDQQVKSKLLEALAFTGDGLSAKPFIEAVKALKDTKDDSLLKSLSEYFNRIGVNPGKSVVVKDFQDLQAALAKIPNGEAYEKNAQEIWMRDIATKKIFMERHNVPSVTPSTKHKK